MLYTFGNTVTYWLVRLLFRVRYEGLENVPSATGFILASNHRSNFDPCFIANRVGKPVHYMAKVELFQKKILGFLLRHVKAFPVSRGTGDTSAIDTAASIIRDGGILGVFPEGTRSKDGKPLRGRSGAALIAAQTGADVLPCAVCYGEKLGFRSVVTVRYGKVIPFEELGADISNRSSIREASRRIMGDIVELLEKGGA